jgi:hypothetical protein
VGSNRTSFRGRFRGFSVSVFFHKGANYSMKSKELLGPRLSNELLGRNSIVCSKWGPEVTTVEVEMQDMKGTKRIENGLCPMQQLSQATL